MRNKKATAKRSELYKQKQELLDQIEKNKFLLSKDLEKITSGVKKEGKRVSLIAGAAVGAFSIVYILTRKKKSKQPAVKNHISTVSKESQISSENVPSSPSEKGISSALLSFMGTQVGQVILSVAKNEVKKFIENSFHKNGQ